MSQRRAKQARRQTGATNRREQRKRQRSWILVALSLAAVAAAVIVAGVLLAGRDDGSSTGGAANPATKSSGERAPELSGIDVVSGKQVRLADFTGTPVVINVWASWCPGCSEEAPDLSKFAKAHPEVQLLGIDLQDTKAAGKAFHERFKWSWPSILDGSGELAARLGLQGLPQTFFLNAEHEVVGQIVGAGDLEALEAELRRALET